MVLPIKFLTMMFFASFIFGGIAAIVIVSIVLVKKSNKKNAGQQYGAQPHVNYNPNAGNNPNYTPQGNPNDNQQMQQQMNDEFNRQAMEEGWKSVTPFDHGGYVQGPGFNPSDTAAQQMNDMNNMNMGMF